VIGANSFGGDAKQGNDFFTLHNLEESNGQTTSIFLVAPWQIVVPVLVAAAAVALQASTTT
jgi:hypothetical protein